MPRSGSSFVAVRSSLSRAKNRWGTRTSRPIVDMSCMGDETYSKVVWTVEKPSNNMDKITQEKYNKSRERSDRISALMGQYMLKGYRMLGSTCEVCGNVLLKYRDQEDYCVACKEVDAPAAPVSRPVGSASASHPQQHSELISVVKSPTSQNAVHTAVHAVNEKMLWASQALSSAHSTGECQQLCELLKTCAETLRALREIQQ